MAYKIRNDEDVAAALVRLARVDIEAVRRGLAGNGPAEARIHRARQRLKRIRSLLKVLRPALGEAADTARAKASQAARLLAGARDADAAAASARELLLESAGNGAVGLDRLVANLDREASERHALVPPFEAVAGLIDEAEAALAAADPGGIAGKRLLDRALEKGYRRGRKAWRQARSSLAMPDLHRWRKEVKHLWHLLRLARGRLPAEAARTARELEKLGELLGLDHDNAILATRLVDQPAGSELMNRLALIAEKRRALEKQAFAIGARLYGKDSARIRRSLRLD